MHSWLRGFKSHARSAFDQPWQVFFVAWIALNFECVNAKGGVHQWNITKGHLALQNKVSHFSLLVTPFHRIM